MQERLQQLAGQNKGLQAQLTEMKRKQAELDCKVGERWREGGGWRVANGSVEMCGLSGLQVKTGEGEWG